VVRSEPPLHPQGMDSLAEKTVKVRINSSMDSWIAVDKGKHFLANVMSTVFLFEVQQKNFLKSRKSSKWIAVGFSLNLSVAKEIWDGKKPNNHFCWKDLMADIAGIVGGILIINQTY